MLKEPTQQKFQNLNFKERITKNMNIRLGKLVKALSLGLVLAIPQQSKAAIILEVGSEGVTIVNSLGNDYSNMLLSIGYWADGFTPTAANFSLWSANFKGISTTGSSPTLLNGGNLGYYLRDDAPDISVSFPVGLNTLAEAYYTLAPANTPLSVIGVNNSNNATSFAGATEYFILTDSAWKVHTVTTSNLSSDVYLSLSSGTTATVGSFTFNSGGVSTISTVPEPSTGALMMIGAAGLVALRRLRKV
jgi:hypothetical protein